MLQIKNNTARLIIARNKKLGQLYLLPGHHVNNVEDESWKECDWIKILKKSKEITVKQVKDNSNNVIEESDSIIEEESVK